MGKVRFGCSGYFFLPEIGHVAFRQFGHPFHSLKLGMLIGAILGICPFMKWAGCIFVLLGFLSIQ